MMEIRIDVSDWEQEYTQEEPNVSSNEAIIERRTEGKMTDQVAKWTIIAREKGDTPEDILRTNKELLHSGACAELIQMIVSRKVKVTLKNGNEVYVREYIAPVRKTEESEIEIVIEDDDTRLVYYQDPIAVDRACDYLMKRVTGYIWGRLKTIAANEGDVRGIANDLEDKIEEMVEELNGTN